MWFWEIYQILELNTHLQAFNVSNRRENLHIAIRFEDLLDDESFQFQMN